MDVSVIVPVRNEEEHLGDQLVALSAQSYDGTWEVVVVDNGSTDRTAAIIARHSSQHPRVRRLDASEVRGKCAAVNLAIAATNSPKLVFCDGDDVVSEGWLRSLADALDTHSVVTGPNELDRLNPPWLASSRGRADEQPAGSFHGVFPTVRGNNYGVRRDVFERVGPLDERFAAAEDAEFSMRCFLRGIEIAGIPDAVVHYRYRRSAKALWRQGFAYGSHRPLIARMLRDAGKTRPPALAGWRSWLLLFGRLPTVVTASGRAGVLWIAGNRIGQLVGSVRHRVVML